MSTFYTSPAFSLYPDRELNATTLMSAAAFGAHMRMKMAAWKSGPIPNVPAKMVRAAGVSPLDPPWGELWAEIAPHWRLVDGAWVNDALEDVRERMAATSAANSTKGAKGAKKKWEGHSKTEPLAGLAPEEMAGAMPVPLAGPSPQPSPGHDSGHTSGHEKTWPDDSLRFRSSVSSSSSGSISEESVAREDQAERPKIDPAEIARIRAKEPCDRTHAENDLLLADLGVVGVERPNRRPRTGIDPSVNHHTHCHGWGTLMCCTRGKALCVPAFLGQEWIDQCGEGAVERVASFIARVVKSIPVGQPIGDPKKFWLREWDREVNGTAAARRRAASTGTTPVDADKYADLEIADQ